MTWLPGLAILGGPASTDIGRRRDGKRTSGGHYSGAVRLDPAAGKALALILGKSMIQRVFERSAQSAVLDSVCVATDDQRIVDVVEGFGGHAVMTSPDHPSGTDRLAEAVQSIEADIIVNIQGDQPFIDPVMIDEGVQPLLDDDSLQMATLMHPIHTPEDLADTGVVKTAVNLAGDALYFSRSLIPYPQKGKARYVFEHVGLYVYRRAFLLKLAQLPHDSAGRDRIARTIARVGARLPYTRGRNQVRRQRVQRIQRRHPRGH